MSSLKEQLEKKDTKWLLARRDKISKHQKELTEILYILSDRATEVIRIQKIERLAAITKKTEYREPEYPSVGVLARSGTCVLNNEAEATELLEALQDKGSYYYGYTMNFTKAGRYLAIPDWKEDHDGDIVYTTLFERIK